MTKNKIELEVKTNDGYTLYFLITNYGVENDQRLDLSHLYVLPGLKAQWTEFRYKDEDLTLIQIQKGNENYMMDNIEYDNLVRYLEDNLSEYYNNPNKTFKYSSGLIKTTIMDKIVV
jgi:hypothetical protein